MHAAPRVASVWPSEHPRGCLSDDRSRRCAASENPSSVPGSPCGSETLLQPFAPDSGSAPSLEQALFGLGQSWLGAMTPKRWARRAVTRNAIRRQVYAVGQGYGACLPCAAHVVRLRAGFDRQKFPSAWSEPLRQQVRAELVQLFERALRQPGAA